MDIYLVGGAVRDELLGIPFHENDWVVVGSSPEEMVALDYQPVGKDFPVFLHPETHEEYALARKEKKIGRGYKGFTFYTDPNITLEEDLSRRDLTINAMAKDDTGKIIDPYNGQHDLKQKVLRHVSTAFSEDPVRLLRVARFAAKLPDFSIDPSTKDFMRAMVNNGEINALTPERVWKECERALCEKQPLRFFEVLGDVGALSILFPDLKLDNLKIKLSSQDSVINFALLTNKLDVGAIKKLCKHYRIPKQYAQLAEQTSHWKFFYETQGNASAEDFLEFIKKSDALRRPERFAKLMSTLNILHPNVNDEKINAIINALKNINIESLQQQDLKGSDFANALQELQLNAIKNI